jgi:hypothetical protein
MDRLNSNMSGFGDDLPIFEHKERLIAAVNEHTVISTPISFAVLLASALL